jgi:hypothetical protein
MPAAGNNAILSVSMTWPSLSSTFHLLITSNLLRLTAGHSCHYVRILWVRPLRWSIIRLSS